MPTRDIRATVPPGQAIDNSPDNGNNGDIRIGTTDPDNTLEHRIPPIYSPRGGDGSGGMCRFHIVSSG